MQVDLVHSLKRIFTASEEAESRQRQISLSEAYALWSLLRDRYVIIDHMSEIKNFSHDKGYKELLEKNIEYLKKENNHLEQLLEMFSIIAPRPNLKDINTTGNTEVVVDRISSHLFFNFLRSEIMILANNLKDAIYNDHIRAFLTDMLKNTLERLEDYIQYMQLKEWLDFPPEYQYLMPNVKERVAINEIHLLWGHLFSRYTNFRLTQIMVGFIDDIDFKALIELGLNILANKINDLENRLLRFGVQLPERFSKIITPIQHTEMIDDRFIFSVIFDGMKNATSLHAVATTDVITNKELRHFFKGVTLEELSYIDKLIKYGKLKGWIQVAPKYKMGVQ